MRKTLFIALIVSSGIQIVLGQSRILEKKIELGGGFSYNDAIYTSSPSKYFYTPANMIPPNDFVVKNITFSPSIGYFIDNSFEFIIVPSVIFSSIKETYSLFQAEFLYEYFSPSIGIGVVYHLNLNRYVIPFVGANVAIQWTKSYPPMTPSTSWSPANILFPDIVLGAKMFFYDNWALTIQMQYIEIKRNPYFYYISIDKSYQYNISFGLAVLL